MTSVSDWSDMFPQTVEHAELVSRDDYGAPSYGTPASYSARVVYQPTRTTNSDGQEVYGKGTVWLLGTPDVDPEDRLVLPDGRTPEILSVTRPSDESGIHHTKVVFG